jgi:methyl-accepting chemotaxis protein
MWKNWSLNTKIIAAFVAISVLVGITGWVAMDGIKRISHFIDGALTVQLKQSELVNDMEHNLLKSQDATGEYLATADSADLTAIRRSFGKSMAAFRTPLAALSKLELDASEATLVTEISELGQSFTVTVGEMMDHHEKALGSHDMVIDRMVEMSATTPRMLKAVQFVGVSVADQNLITEQVLRAFSYVATGSMVTKVRYQALGNEIKLSAHYDSFAEHYEAFIQVAGAAIAAADAEKQAVAAARADMERLDKISLSLQQRAEKLLLHQRQEITAAQNDILAIETSTGNLMAGLSVGAMILSLLIGFALSRAIVRPLTRTIDALSEGAVRVDQSSSTISRASLQQAEGASEQAAAIQETTATMGDMTSRTEENARNAVTASGLAAETRDAATNGNERMKEMADAMRQIHDSSNEIAKVINVIDDIAFQTNILALNAAVEAARAGEAGMGFAVVADEVRNLAQRSAAAAKDTASMISESITRATRGVSIMEGAGEALDQITSRALEVSDLVDQIADASRDQSSGIFQMTQAMQQMELVTQQAASSAEHSASSGEQLNSQVNGLRHLVSDLGTMVWGEKAHSQLEITSGGSEASEHAEDQPWMKNPELGSGDMRIISPVRGKKPDHDIDLF